MPLDNTTSGVQFLADASVALYIALQRDMTVQGKDGETNVHRRVAANSCHVGTQSEASKRACPHHKRLSLHHKGTFTTRSQHPVLQVAIVDEG